MKRFATGLFAALLITLMGTSAHATEKLAFQIEKCKTHVSIAAVKLSVGELTEVDGKLVGAYTIKVPLQKSKNDEGRIELPLETSITELGKNGGKIEGKAFSDILEDKRPRKIVCEIIPQEDQTILLAITTPNRTLNFKSRYKVVEAGKQS